MSCETLVWGKCYACGNGVAVKANRSKLAYYRCDHCGIEMRHHWHKSSDRMLGGLGVSATAPAPESAAPKVEEKPQSAAKSGSLLSMLNSGE